MERKYKIISSTVEEFKKLDKKIKELPDSVIGQIETVEQKFTYINCTFFTSYSNKVIVYAPEKDINLMNMNENGFDLFTSEFRFILEKNNKDQQLEIRFR